MDSSLLQKSGFLTAYPEKEVIKRVVGEKIRFRCTLEQDIKDVNVEVWTDLTGRFHGHELKKNSEEYSLDVDIKHTGFFKVTFRWKNKDGKFWNWQSGTSEKDFSEIHVDPAYIDDSIVYNAFIRFLGQEDIENHKMPKYGMAGTFDDLKHRLDEIRDMGVDVLYLNPIHPIGELFRNYNPHDQYPAYMQPGCPYSIKDYKSIDPEIAVDKDHSQGPYASLSDPMKEFRDLVDEAHKRGIKIYMDLVFNHTSHDFVLQRLHPEWFLYKEDIKSLNTPYIYPDEIKTGKPWGDAMHTFCPYDHGYWWSDAAQLNWEYMIPDASNKPPKNPSITEMYEYFKSIPKYWIKHFGVDGFRCDVAYRVPASFWKQCIREAREFSKKEHPKNGSISGDIVFIAESYADDVRELLESGFSAVYGDYSNKLYNVLTLKGYLDYIYNLNGKFFPEGSRFFIFPECHDFIRNTKKLISQMSENELLGERANKSRWVITATLPGIPMIFNGFEKTEWHPVNLFSYGTIDWESDKDLKKFITSVNKIRRKYLAFQKGDYTYLGTNQGLTAQSQIFSYMRRCRGTDKDKKDSENFIVCVNMDIHNKAGATIYLNDDSGIDFSNEYTLNDLLNHKKYVRNGKEFVVLLEPGDSHIFKIEQ